MSQQNKRHPNHAQDEDCRERVCEETQNKFKNWMKNKSDLKDKNPDCPLDRNTLGRNTWSLLHTMAAVYPKKPSQEDKQNMQEFIKIMSVMYPCKHCAHDFRKDIEELPPRLEDRNGLSMWFCQIHNKVNKKLNKPLFDCSRIEERWRTGPKDGSCDW